MNKLGMVLGAAAIATLAGCKDPDYKYENAPSAQEEVKVVESEKNLDVKPVEVKPVEIKEAPVEKPVIVADLTQSAVPARSVAEAETTYVVQSGDSLSKISKRYNVTISSIRRLNPSLKGDVIRVGQKLQLPGKIGVAEQKTVSSASTKKAVVVCTGASTTYVVKSGDTLGGIAIANGVTVRQLKECNGLKKDSIRVGQKLKVPAKATAKATEKKTAAKKTAAAPVKTAAKKAEKKVEVASPVAAPAVESAPAAASVAESAPAVASAAEAAPETPASAAEPAPAAPAAAPEPAAQTATYVVQEGDDMTGISIRWGVSAAAIRELNNLGENDQLKPGQVIKLPADAQQ